MTEQEKLKYVLLESVGFDLAKAKGCYDFIAGESGTTKGNGEKGQLADGIYFVYADGEPVLFEGEECRKPGGCIGIGVKWGQRAIVVALQDAANGDDITLTNGDDNTDYDGYIDNYLDAVADWDGEANTKHLQEIGLNQRIKLKDGWHIPSLGEMYFVFLNRRRINKALELVGGTPIKGVWYWTSTERSATYAWLLDLSYGGAYTYTKASLKYRVRAVSAFIS